jgi:hypothetical protein
MANWVVGFGRTSAADDIIDNGWVLRRSVQAKLGYFCAADGGVFWFVGAFAKIIRGKIWLALSITCAKGSHKAARAAAQPPNNSSKAMAGSPRRRVILRI